MGDGVSFPQRHMDEDEDSLLSGRQTWMEEGGGRDVGALSPTYRKNVLPLQLAKKNILKSCFILYYRNCQHEPADSIGLMDDVIVDLTHHKNSCFTFFFCISNFRVLSIRISRINSSSCCCCCCCCCLAFLSSSDRIIMFTKN